MPSAYGDAVGVWSSTPVNAISWELGTPSGLALKFYHLNNYILTEVDNANYLGVLFTNDMSWSLHISSIVSEAHQRLGFIRRNLRGSPFKCREIAYTSLVRSQLEYSSVIWDPTLKKEANNIERIHRIAARWACGQYGIISVTQLLKDLKWAPLADRRRHHHLILLYKILNHHLVVPPGDVDIRWALRPPRRGHSRQLQRPRAGAKSSPLWHSTTFRTIPEWNSLPAPVAELTLL